jgi:hypothetical protein
MLNNTNNLSRLKTVLVAIISFYIFSTPFFIDHYNLNGRALLDEQHFHLPAIEKFANDKTFDDYTSATTPGYHLVLSLLLTESDNISTDNLQVIRILGSLFTALFIGSLAWQLSFKFSLSKVLLLISPVIASIYVLPSGVWLLPDNSNWLCVSISLMLLNSFYSHQGISDPKSTKFFIWLLFVSVMLVLAVWFRQTSIWLVSIFAFLSFAILTDINKTVQHRLKLITFIFLSLLPALLSLLYFFMLWNGFVPPSFQKTHLTPSPSSPAFFLTALFFYSSFYFPIVFNELKTFVIQEKTFRYVISAGVAGFIIGIFPETSYNMAEGRNSGLWNFVKLFPSIEEKSPLIITGSTLGASCLSFWICLSKEKLRLPLLGGTLVFMISLIMNKFVYERYIAAYLFIFILFVLATSDRVTHVNKQLKLFTGCVLFFIFNTFVIYNRIA